jgi:hypothetical protein
MSEFTNRFGVWQYTGLGTVAEAKLAARKAGLKRFAVAGIEWYWHRQAWRHD